MWRQVDGGAALHERLHAVRRVRRAATVALVVVGLEAHLRTMERRGAPRTAVDHATVGLCCHASGVRQHNVRDVEDAVRFLVGVTEHLAKLPYWPEEGYLTIFGALHAKRNRQIASVMDEEDGFVGHATYDDSQVCVWPSTQYQQRAAFASIPNLYTCPRPKEVCASSYFP
jgi:hypothetical protein